MAYKVGDKIKYTKPGESQKVGTIKQIVSEGRYAVQPSTATSRDNTVVTEAQIDGYA